MAVQKYDIRRPTDEGGGFEERYWSPVNSPVFGDSRKLTYIIHRVEDVTEFVHLKMRGIEQEQRTQELRTRSKQIEAEVFLRAQQIQEANQKLREANDELTRLRADLEQRVQDRTAELRATTQQLWQAARLAGVGELAASIAHELNNPLGTVSLRIEGLLAKTPGDDPRRKALEIVEGEVDRMAGLVGNLLQFSRAGRDQVSTVDVCDEINKTAELISHQLRKQRVRLAVEFAPDVPTIQADRQHLRQVFLNLFTNAADAMPEGGSLIPRVRLGELQPGTPAIVIEVADTGAGIPSELLSKVFDPFFTTKEEGKGTGLGLAICKRIVDQHHGKLAVESQVGRGTTIRVTLPVRQETNVAGLQADDRSGDLAG
jgi:signal transduction histidine kinase